MPFTGPRAGILFTSYTVYSRHPLLRCYDQPYRFIRPLLDTDMFDREGLGGHSNPLAPDSKNSEETFVVDLSTIIYAGNSGPLRGIFYLMSNKFW